MAIRSTASLRIILFCSLHLLLGSATWSSGSKCFAQNRRFRLRESCCVVPQKGECQLQSPRVDRIRIQDDLVLIRIASGTTVFGDREQSEANSQFSYELRLGCERWKRVVIPYSFYIGQTEVTVGQFRQFVEDSGYTTTAESPSGVPAMYYDPRTGKSKFGLPLCWDNPGFEQTDRHPVVNVSWIDAKAYCEWLSKKIGRRVRLPSEIEWEFAARAGLESDSQFVDRPQESGKFANLNSEAENWAGGKSSGRFGEDGHLFTAPVATFLPNHFGIYDMIGNVEEMCIRQFNLETDVPVTSPKWPETEPVNIPLRGSSFWYGAGNCNALNSATSAFDVSSDVGFRVIIEVDE
jgi:sulfatase modifying factor 1